jgi:hypothetical protein
MTNLEREALRDFVLTVARGEAQKAMAELRADTLRYRGVWQAAQTYRRGDMVTHAGSTWHCNAVDGTTDRPGTGSTFSLMFKGA